MISARPQRLWPAGVYLLLVSGGLYLIFSHWVYDDPFITYRYAQNFARGQGLVYNPGEHILSTTTPLFALLLGLLQPLWPNLPRLANLIGILSLAAGGLLLFDLAKSWETPLVGWAGLFLYPAFGLVVTTIGSETPLYLALCLGTFALYARRRYTWAGVLAALAVLARGEGLLLPVILGLDYLWRVRKPIPWGALAAYGVIFLPWALAGWWYYGSPLPVTLAAKQGQGVMAISQKFAPGFLTVAGWYAQSWLYRIEALLAVAGAAFLEQRWGLVLAWTLLYFAAYTALGVTRYAWYYAPLVPGFVILVGLGIHGVAELIKGWLPRLGNRATILGLAALILLGTFQAIRLPAVQENSDKRFEIYRDVGLWLNEHTPQDASVGMLEVGIIGYYADRRVIDFAGLLQPEVAAQFSPTITYDDIGLWAIQRYQPDYLVLHSRAFPKTEQYAVAHCAPARRFVSADYDYNRDLVVYDCR